MGQVTDALIQSAILDAGSIKDPDRRAQVLVQISLAQALAMEIERVSQQVQRIEESMRARASGL